MARRIVLRLIEFTDFPPDESVTVEISVDEPKQNFTSSTYELDGSDHFEDFKVAVGEDFSSKLLFLVDDSSGELFLRNLDLGEEKGKEEVTVNVLMFDDLDELKGRLEVGITPIEFDDELDEEVKKDEVSESEKKPTFDEVFGGDLVGKDKFRYKDEYGKSENDFDARYDSISKRDVEEEEFDPEDFDDEFEKFEKKEKQKLLAAEKDTGDDFEDDFDEEEELYDIDNTAKSEKSKVVKEKDASNEKDKEKEEFEDEFAEEENLEDIGSDNLFNAKSTEEEEEEKARINRFQEKITSGFFDLLRRKPSLKSQVVMETIPERIITQLSKIGLIVPIYSSNSVVVGNSQFNSVCRSVYGNDFQSTNLRYEVCCWLKSHSEYQSNDGRSLSSMISSGKWIDYCSSIMKLNETEGDLITLHACAEVLRSQILLFRFQNNFKELVKETIIPKKIVNNQKIRLVTWERKKDKQFVFCNLKVMKRFALLIYNDFSFVPNSSGSLNDLEEEFSDLSLVLEDLGFSVKSRLNLNENMMRKTIYNYFKFFQDNQNKNEIEMVFFGFFGMSQFSKGGKNFLIPFETVKRSSPKKIFTGIGNEERTRKSYTPSTFFSLESLFSLFKKFVPPKVLKVCMLDCTRKVNGRSYIGKKPMLPRNTLFMSSSKIRKFSKGNNEFLCSFTKCLSQCRGKNFYRILNEFSKNSSYLLSYQKSLTLRKFHKLKSLYFRVDKKFEQLNITNFFTMKRFVESRMQQTENETTPVFDLNKVFKDYVLFKKKSKFTKSKIERDYRKMILKKKQERKRRVFALYSKEKSIIDTLIMKIVQRNRRKLTEFLDLKNRVEEGKFSHLHRQYSALIKKKGKTEKERFRAECVIKFKYFVVKNLDTMIEKQLKLNSELIEFKSYHFGMIKENIQFNSFSLKESKEKIAEVKKNTMKFYFSKLSSKFEEKRKKGISILQKFVRIERLYCQELLVYLYKSALRMVKNHLMVEFRNSTNQKERNGIIDDFQDLKSFLGRELVKRKKNNHQKFLRIEGRARIEEKYHQAIEGISMIKEKNDVLFQFLRLEKSAKNDFAELKNNTQKTFTREWEGAMYLRRKLKEGRVNSKLSKTMNFEKSFSNIKIKNPLSPLSRTLTQPNSLTSMLAKKSRTPKVKKNLSRTRRKGKLNKSLGSSKSVRGLNVKGYKKRKKAKINKASRKKLEVIKKEYGEIKKEGIESSNTKDDEEIQNMMSNIKSLMRDLDI